ncbi:hypothetical protein BCR44DRAFT_382979 [Catenaria anguillulae PL171]|uniref:Uncharacterized protein n=1 Tax=Catenaria anguillulae PL171 TaxID=765915 RepID=A0A1Y2HFN4_9FUNG|nr:hypothetical protein BCR44DRAFT_382979 [Catenaria anguillulae PL171]
MLRMNPIFIALNILIIVINGSVAYTTVRHPKLYSSLLAGASTRILFSLCFVYIVLGVGQLIVRLLLQMREAWSEVSVFRFCTGLLPTHLALSLFCTTNSRRA